MIATSQRVTIGLDWPRRPRIEIRNEWRRRIWRTRCGRYRVVHAHCLLGGDNSYADSWRAEIWLRGGGGQFLWSTLSNHLQLDTAQAACQRHARTASSSLSRRSS